MRTTAVLPVWAVALGALVGAVVVVVLVRRARHALAGQLAAAQPAWYEYRADQFFEVLWHWGWSVNRIVHLTARCPKCSYKLTRRQTALAKDMYTPFYVTQVECEHCGFQRVINGSIDEVEKRVLGEVDRKLVTGEWSTREPIKRS
jgi:DNA-directed RNA polymerase subunit RPC12/RpoP